MGKYQLLLNQSPKTYEISSLLQFDDAQSLGNNIRNNQMEQLSIRTEDDLNKVTSLDTVTASIIAQSLKQSKVSYLTFSGYIINPEVMEILCQALSSGSGILQLSFFRHQSC